MNKISLLVCLATSLSFAEYIGVLAKEGTCPADQALKIFIDAEDHDHETRILRGDKKPLGVDVGRDIKFSYCMFNYEKAVRVPYDYVVLKMDRKCPKGSYAFARYHDAEDNNNKSWYEGNIGPSSVRKNAYLTYCYVPADPKSKIKYPFKKKYGIFANPSGLPSSISDNVAHSEIFIDDEDNNNKNGWQWYQTKSEYKDPIRKIVSVKYKDPESGKVVESKKNTVYHTLRWTGSDSDLPAMGTYSKTKIGVLKRDSTVTCSDELSIYLDLEDHKNKTAVESGSKNPPGIKFTSNGNVKFTYCALAVDEMPRVPYGYMVLKLGRYCPAGTYQVFRHHDTEDDDNENSFSGSIWPNSVKHNVDLVYCYVPADSKSKQRYPFEGDDARKYGVFANPTNVSKSISDNISHSEILLDDEDDRTEEEVGEECEEDTEWTEIFDKRGNIVGYEEEKKEECQPVYVYYTDNIWDYYGLSENDPDERKILSGIKGIMYGVDNTYYHVIKWKGSASAVLARSVNENSVEELAVTGVVAPKIMGFDNSAVTIEARATGKVSVSIMNAKGAVVANVAQDNFQPGIHRVNWNSGPVPNGRYIVVVKQNGMETAKNVILK
ncbi:MAG: hypothetical protein J5521_02450 [Lachnospiraceae bacterium]|nr:hypothetical protein [Lachnospiraceae bacterium]